MKVGEVITKNSVTSGVLFASAKKMLLENEKKGADYGN